MVSNFVAGFFEAASRCISLRPSTLHATKSTDGGEGSRYRYNYADHNDGIVLCVHAYGYEQRQLLMHLAFMIKKKWVLCARVEHTVCVGAEDLGVR